MAEQKENFPAYIFHEGTNYRSYLYFGSHDAVDPEGKPCTVFRVWAPKARYISVTGDFCNWSEEDGAIPMKKIDDGGIWEAYGYGFKEYDTYKYRVVGCDGRVVFKSDPYIFLRSILDHRKEILAVFFFRRGCEPCTAVVSTCVNHQPGYIQLG